MFTVMVTYGNGSYKRVFDSFKEAYRYSSGAIRRVESLQALGFMQGIVAETSIYQKAGSWDLLIARIALEAGLKIITSLPMDIEYGTRTMVIDTWEDLK